jgi:hypothetical protein
MDGELPGNFVKDNQGSWDRLGYAELQTYLSGMGSEGEVAKLSFPTFTRASETDGSML